MQYWDSDKWIARPTQCRALLQARSDKIRVGFGQVARWQMCTSCHQWKLPTQVCGTYSYVHAVLVRAAVHQFRIGMPHPWAFAQQVL